MAHSLWIPVRFKGEQVLARCDDKGVLTPGRGGLVDFRYRPAGKVYRTKPDRFERVAGAKAEALDTVAGQGGGRGAKQGSHPVVSLGHERAGAVHLWTDGACSGNPGPSGLGVYAELDGEVFGEISEYLGQGTNNIAELTAMLRALALVDDPRRAVDLMSDSDYGIKVVTGVYKAKKNRELILEIRQAAARFTDLQFVKVPGHAGVPGNERADELAVLAVERRANWRSCER